MRGLRAAAAFDPAGLSKPTRTRWYDTDATMLSAADAELFFQQGVVLKMAATSFCWLSSDHSL